MKPFAETRSTEYFSRARALPRPMWRGAPIRRPVATDLGHETEVIRALTLAVPISLALWVPLIWAAVSWF